MTPRKQAQHPAPIRGLAATAAGRCLLALALALCIGAAAETPVALQNPSFEKDLTPAGVPEGWRLYGGRSDLRRLKRVPLPDQDGVGIRLEDDDANGEIGLTQNFAAAPGETYRVSLTVYGVEGHSTAGAYAQLRFQPSDRYVQTGLNAEPGKAADITLYHSAPPGTTSATLYIYTHQQPTPHLVIDTVRVDAGVTPPPGTTTRTTAMPEPIPPQYTTLKALHLTTALVEDNLARAVIVMPGDGSHARLAAEIQDAVRAITSVELPVVQDSDPAADLPLKQHVIALGNRSNNRLISALYDAFYALVDLKYPGPGGHVLRSVHSPFGDGYNVIICGGSDTQGTAAAAQALRAAVNNAPGGAGTLRLGWLQDIRLGDGSVIPEDITEVRIWEESGMYGSSGYFGWNVISKNMALYAMTGEERYAREFLRLAFPDQAVIAELEELDGERIENKHDPLAGPYHYSAHMMILFWDLIEESPLFDDALRLRITNAFSRQLTHRAREHVYGISSPPGHVGNRHGDWSAMSLYALARYFAKDYSDPLWKAGLESVATYFSALKRSPWLAGNNDHLFWYTSYYDPILDYIIMSGDRSLLDEGHLLEALRTQDVLFTGAGNDWGLRASSLNFLQRTGYLTGDGRWAFYRDRTGLDTDTFRLGQSFWEPDLAPREPSELCHTWTIQHMPEPMWQARQPGFPLQQAFLWASFRNTLDEAGDYILVKGHNGGGRNPYHTFSLLELRLAGQTLLKGYQTQVLTTADGLVEPTVAMNGALTHAGVAGRLAVATGEVPNHAFCAWQRTVAVKSGRAALVADRLTYRTDSDNLSRVTGWDTVGGKWDPDHNRIVIPPQQDLPDGDGWLTFKALAADCTSNPSNQDAARSLIELPAIGIRMLKATEPGHYLDMPFTLEKPFSGDLLATLLDYKDRGTVAIYLNGELVADEVQHWAPDVASKTVALGHRSLPAGTHTLRVQAVSRREELDRCYIGLVGLTLQQPGAPTPQAPPRVEMHPADLVQGKGSGAIHLTNRGPVRGGSTDVGFTLIAPSSDSGDGAIACLRLADNAAALRLPGNGVAVSGAWAGTDATLALFAEDSLAATGLRRAAAGSVLLEADTPLDVDWDFAAATLHLNATAETILAVALDTPESLTLDGAPMVAQRREDGLWRLTVPAGGHLLGSATPPPPALQSLAQTLAKAVAEGHELRAEAQRKQRGTDGTAAAAWTPAHTRTLDAAVDSLVTCPGSSLGFAAANETRITAFAADGTPAWTRETQGNIRTLHWWPEHRLLLAGCLDEQVIAWDETGTEAWRFTSEMHQEVWEAAKQYWFKSAHPGIYGIDTGVFINGESQCFVGSACTLEILGPDGALVERLPVFWGPGWRYGLRDAADGSRDLLLARLPTDSHALTIINSRTRTITGRSFDGVPPGHTYVTGWSTMSRNHLVITDLDGDGNDEVVSEINGAWNRITIWNIDGSPRYNAQIGPGKRIPARTVTSLDVADLDGNGQKEIVFTLASGLLVALDCTCERLWSVAFPSAPATVRTVPTGRGGEHHLAVGCADGTVALLDPGGKVLAKTQLDGPVTTSAVRQADGAAEVLFGTAKGQVAAFAPIP